MTVSPADDRAPCDLQIVLDEPERSYRPGDALGGEVVVLPRAAREPPVSVEVSLRWRVRGAAPAAEGAPVVAHHRLSGWRPGDEPRTAGVPFELRVPVGPPAYAGQLFGVEWLVEALAITPHCPAVAVEERVLVTRDGRAPAGALHAPVPIDRWRRRLLFATGGCFAALGAGAALGAALAAPALTAPAAAALLTGAAVLAWAHRDRLVERRLGPVRVELTPEVAAGGSVLVRVALAPPRPIWIDGASAWLSAEEVVTGHGGPQDQAALIHEVHTVGEALHSGGVLRGGAESLLEVRLPVPGDIPSLELAQAQVRWRLHVELRVPSWPAWRLTTEVTVLPRPHLAIGPVRVVALQPGQRCPYCHDRLDRAEGLFGCAGCGAVLHADCHRDHGGCTTTGCRNAVDPRRRRA